LYYNLSPHLRPGTAPYQQYNDTGRRRALAAIDYKSGLADLYLFGETAISDNGAVATLNGARYSGRGPVAVAVIYRRYDKRYTSYYSGGFGEYSNTSNEEGLYAGVEVTPARDLKLNLYHDRFRYFAPRYRATTPGSGRETLAGLTYQRPRGEWLARFKHEKKPGDTRVDGILQTLPRERQEYRLQYTCRALAPRLETRSRLEQVRYRHGSARHAGTLFYQDVALYLEKPDLTARVRLAYFDVDAYDARVYAYENDVLHGFSFPAYYYRGYRSYLNLDWHPTRAITLYAKAGVIYYPDRTSISSSLTRVNDNKLFDFTFQVRIKL
jgi:hypothetical protein